MRLVLMVLRCAGLVVGMVAKRLGAEPGCCRLAHVAQQTAAFREIGIAPVRLDQDEIGRNDWSGRAQ